MPCIKLGQNHKVCLLAFARQSIEHGLQFKPPLPVDLAAVETVLHQPAATFVTLRYQQRLVGCIGSLQATQPLLMSVVHNAHSAAFLDRRFAPLEQDQLAGLEIEIAVLSELIPVDVHSEQTLMEFLQPGEHGLVLEYGGQRATFLPKVWAQLPDKSEFLAQLKEKAGLPADFWSPQIQISSYTTASFSNLSR